jgi:hypothetical protein
MKYLICFKQCLDGTITCHLFSKKRKQPQTLQVIENQDIEKSQNTNRLLKFQKGNQDATLFKGL